MFLHPVAGPLVFLAVVVAVFQTIFSAARPLMDLVDAGVRASGAWIGALLPASALRSLLVEGVWGGVGSVLVFLPQILLLFLFIGLLEDSGYLARAALIADRTMRKAGLQGKSFLPLLSAYACAVPAVLASRTIENKRDRIATILIAPFMTCSARLPVYTLIIAAFLPERPVLGPFLGTRAAAMLGLYVLGFLAAFGTARLLKSSVLKSDGSPFLLEMPPYRRPTLRQITLRMFDRSKIFLRRAGTVILGVAVVLWVLAHLPLAAGKMPEVANSVAGTLGRALEPLVRPLGFDWKIAIGLVTSLAAREVIVGTLGTLYGMDHDGGDRGSPGGAPARPHARRRRRPPRLLRVRDAVPLDGGGRAARDERLEVAGRPVRVHDAPRLFRRVRREPGRHAAPELRRGRTGRVILCGSVTRKKFFDAAAHGTLRRSPPACARTRLSRAPSTSAGGPRSTAARARTERRTGETSPGRSSSRRRSSRPEPTRTPSTTSRAKRGSFKATPLWYAVAWGRNANLVSLLLRSGASPRGCLWACVWADDLEMAKTLVKAGAPLNETIGGETPLEYAVRAKRPAFVKLLRKR